MDSNCDGSLNSDRAGCVERHMDVFSGAWVPISVAGVRRHVSYLDLMAGAHEDAVEIDHPLPEMRAWARMLLGALTQAVCPLADASALRDALRRPVAVTIPASYDANRTLLDSPGGRFLQPDTPDPTRAVDRGTALLVFDEAHTYGNTRTGRRSFPDAGAAGGVEAICPSCALIALFGMQSQAPQGGRGYSPSVCGTGRFTTLPVLPSLRASAHAATLTRARVAAGPWPVEPATAPPWRFQRTAAAGDAIGLLQGLFWTPRAIRVEVATGGVCPLCGDAGERVAVREFAAGSKVAGGFWRCPWTPWRQHPKKPDERWHVGTPVRPAWTEYGGAVADVGETHVADVIAQLTHDLGLDTVELLLVGVRFNQTKWHGTLAEPARLHVAQAPRAAMLAAQADAARRALHAALRRAQADDARRALHTALGRTLSPETLDHTFWRATEAAFHADLAGDPAVNTIDTANGAQVSELSKTQLLSSAGATTPARSFVRDPDTFERVVRRTVWNLFRDALGATATHGTYVGRIATAQRALGRDLDRAFQNPEPSQESKSS